MPKPPRSLKGHLLLDGGKLRGSYFHRSVVLVCEHTSEGAFGVVINRPSELRLRDVVEGELPTRFEEGVVYSGGPVEPSSLSFLCSSLPEVSDSVVEGVVFRHDFGDLFELPQSASVNLEVRFFAGYAGWSPGQLDEELRRESWLVHPATRDLVFSVPSERLWRQVLIEIGGWQARLLADSPEDLSSN